MIVDALPLSPTSSKSRFTTVGQDSTFVKDSTRRIEDSRKRSNEDAATTKSNKKPRLEDNKQTLPTASYLVPTSSVAANDVDIDPTTTSSRRNLLATPSDKAVLNPLHVFVREQIEIFTATHDDISQPAPGSKEPGPTTSSRATMYSLHKVDIVKGSRETGRLLPHSSLPRVSFCIGYEV